MGSNKLTMANCGECWFAKPHNNGIPADSGSILLCHRFPQSLQKRAYDWCGEFVGKIELEAGDHLTTERTDNG
jgi:hypothetical protein